MVASESISSSWTTTLILLISCVVFTYSYFKYKFTYWRRRGIRQVRGIIPCGSLTKFIIGKRSIAEVIADVYNSGKGHKYVGYYSFTSPQLAIRDLDLIKRILVKDFDNFADRGVYYNENIDSLSAHIFALNGIEWKNVRTKISPAFSSGKIKFMYETMKICVSQMKDLLVDITNKNENPIDFKYLIARHGLNTIANTAVGIEGHTINGESEWCEAALKATDPNLIQALRFVLALLGKDVAKLLRLRFTPKDVEIYYLDLVEKILDYRMSNRVKRNDFMHLLMEIWDITEGFSDNKEKEVIMKKIAAQTFLFVLAAYESTSSTICFALYELAINPEIQEKLINEVDSVDEDVTYEVLNELKYLDMVLSEVWRKYPPGGVLLRECNRDFDLGDGNVLERKVTVTIPVLGLHTDPELFPEPEKFDPERFNKDSPSHEIKPFSYLPFGEGPRFCVGKRYGKTQTKLTLFSIIKNFRIETCDKTKIPSDIDPKTFVLQPNNGMYLRAINRKKSN